MKTQILLGLMLMFCVVISKAQNTELERDANVFSNAMIEADVEKMIQYTYEGLIEKGGGPFYIAEEYVNDYNSRIESNTDYQGVRVIAEADPVVFKGELQVFISLEFTTNFQGQNFHTYSNLLAISTNKGLDWKFVDISRHDATSLQEFLPNLSSDLEFPVSQEAVLLDKD